MVQNCIFPRNIVCENEVLICARKYMKFLNIDYQETLHMHKNLGAEVEMVGDSSVPPLREALHPEKSLYKNRPLMSSIAAYCVFTLHDTAYSEVTITALSVFLSQHTNE
jgi:hypothetical protein